MDLRQSSFCLFCAARWVSTASTSTCDIGVAAACAGVPAAGAPARAAPPLAPPAVAAEPAEDDEAGLAGAASFALAEPEIASLIFPKMLIVSSWFAKCLLLLLATEGSSERGRRVQSAAVTLVLRQARPAVLIGSPASWPARGPWHRRSSESGRS